MTAFNSDELIVELSPDESTLTEAGILVIDEDPAFQLGLKTFLKEYVGFEKVFTARSGKEAIELIDKEESIELLTVDFQMPGMDGIELLKHLRENSPRPLGVTMITGFPSEKLRKEFDNLTSSKLLTNHFLAKPVEFEKLEPVILDSYEELKRSQMLTETMTGGDEIAVEDAPVADQTALALAASNRELMARLDSMEEKMEQSLKALRDSRQGSSFKSFCLDILKLLVAAAIAWGVWQSGILSRLPIGNNNPNPPMTEFEYTAPVPAALEPETAPEEEPEPPTTLESFPLPE